MLKLFLRVLVISAIAQFILTRYRAGRAIEEGAAEAMWLRYPLHVLLNALVWTALSASVGAGVRAIRRLT